MTADAVGGVWTYAVDLAGALRTHGVDVELAVFGPAPSAAQTVSARAAGVSVTICDAGLDWLAETPELVRNAAQRLAALVRERRPEILHLNAPALAGFGPFDTPTIAVAHSCVATWWRAVRGGPLPADLAWRAELCGAGLRRADVVVAPSWSFADATQRAYGLERPPIVVHNGRADAARAVPPERRDGALMIGRLWDAAKNFEVFDAAAQRAKAPFIAAGPIRGPNRAEIAARHATALGPLDPEAVSAELARRPVFVSCALYEPFGLSVLEAAQAGCALVLSDIPTFRELWGGAAWFAPVRDPLALAAAVDRLIADPERRARLEDAARARARRFGLATFAARMSGLYQRLAITGDRSAA